VVIEDRLSWVLAQSGRHAGGLIQRTCAERGLKPLQSRVLILLTTRGSLSQQRLLEELGVDPSVLVTLLNDLERDDLAWRRRNPADRRRHIVELTERGGEVVAEIDCDVAARERELFADFAEGDVRTLRNLLGRIRPGGAEPDAC